MNRLSRQQVREVDRIAIEEYGIPSVILMENAARGVADVIAVSGFRARVDDRRAALIACGPGNNGGDGFAIARHLHLRGWQVGIAELADEWSGDAKVNRDIAHKLPLRVFRGTEVLHADVQGYDLIVDAIFGTGLNRPLPVRCGNFIRLLGAVERLGRIVAVDLPSGLDCDSGVPLGETCVRADRTVTFVAEKLGFGKARSREFTGEVSVVDIGAPPEIVARVLREMPA